MKKKKVGLLPESDNFLFKTEKVIITGIKDGNAFIYQDRAGAIGILPFYRFLSEEEFSKVKIGSVVKLNSYFNSSGKRVRAYHARFEQ